MFMIFERFTEILGWLRIAASPFLIGLGIGAIIYFTDPTDTRFIIGIIFAFAGLIAGILWAIKIGKSKDGTMSYLSKISSLSETDKTQKGTTEPNAPKKNE